MSSRKLARSIGLSTAAIAVAIAAYAIVNSSSSTGASGTANAATFVQSGPNERVVGQIPKELAPRERNDHHRSGGEQGQSRCARQYPGGTVNRVLKFSDGSYAVKYIRISWPHHIFVSKNFKVTGAIG